MKDSIKYIIRVCIAIVLLAVIVLTNEIAVVFEYLIKIPILHWTILFIVMMMGVFLVTIRFSLFLPKKKFSLLLRVRMMSTAYALILPGQLAAEGVRAYFIGKDDKNYGHSSAAVIVDKLVGIIALFILGMIGIVLSRGEFDGFAILFLITFIILIFAIFSISIKPIYAIFQKLLFVLPQKNRNLSKISAFLLQILDNWNAYANNKKIIALSIVYSIVFQLSISFMGSFLTYSVSGSWHFFDWLWIHAVLTILLLLPLSLGGMGVREGGLIGLLGVIDILPEQALAVSFGYLALQIMQALVGIGMEIFIAMRKGG